MQISRGSRTRVHGAATGRLFVLELRGGRMFFTDLDGRDTSRSSSSRRERGTQIVKTSFAAAAVGARSSLRPHAADDTADGHLARCAMIRLSVFPRRWRANVEGQLLAEAGQFNVGLRPVRDS
jgi:hypothetical protein